VSDEYEQSMATLIHDLKNEVTAARVALDQRPASRTEQLSAQHAASEHLDRVADLGRRLRDADLLYSAADLVGVTDLAPFLQAYSSDQIRRLPQQVRLVPPRLTPASVSIEERALRAILDNLIKNAQEAIPESGTITIEYESFLDDYRVLLEVANSGPPIPDSIIVALQSGQPIASAKRSGSGLGLLGIRRILRRVGGDLEAANRRNGPAMLVTLPLMTDDSEGDEEAYE
jgi:signal transduction histidine kinase